MRDGVTLYADVYRPVADGKYPVLVSRTPYSTEHAPSGYAAAVYFAQRGYVYVFQDVRPPARIRRQVGTLPPRSQQQLRHHRVGGRAALVQRQGGHAGRLLPGPRAMVGRLHRAAHLVTIFPALAAVNLYKDRITWGGAWKLGASFGWGRHPAVAVIRVPESAHHHSGTARRPGLRQGDLASAAHRHAETTGPQSGVLLRLDPPSRLR